ncbi:MAG: hypothetical protein U0359_24105 [Byssovorax sp.]
MIALLSGCTGAAPPGGASPAPGTPAANPGHINAGLVALAARLPGAEKLRIRTDAAGAISKIALYHQDASQVPAAILALAGEKLPGAKVRRYETEIYADKGRAFDVEVTSADGRECEVAALASGALLYTECAIKLDDLPAPVKAAALKIVPGGQIIEAEHKQGPGVDEHTVEVKGPGLVQYLRLGPGGELLWHGARVPAFLELTWDPKAPLPAADDKPGHLDRELIALAARAEGVQKAKLRTSHAGDVLKIALYHKDASQIPAPVKELAVGAGSKLGAYESELFADKGTVFEVEMLDEHNRECEVGARADGQKLYTECSVDAKSVPEKVKAAALAAVPGGTLDEVERKEGDGAIEYSVEVKSAGGLHYIKVAEGGEILWHGLRLPVDLEVTVP